MEAITVTLIVLAATWASVFNIVKVIEIMNAKRDLVLDINEAGSRLTIEQKRLLMTHDFAPMWIGVIAFLLIFTGGLASIPFTYWSKNVPFSITEAIGCFGAATFSGFALIASIFCGFSEYKTMKKHLKSLDEVS